MRALVYGDVDLNIIDGSAIWAQAMVQALHEAGVEVTFVLKAPVRTDRLVAPLERLPGVTVRRRPDGVTTSMTVEEVAQLLTELDEAEPFDLAVVRGRRLAVRLTATPLAGRLWTYLTDVPQNSAEIADNRGVLGELAAVAKASRFLLCQTEELRCFLEGTLNKAAGKCVLFPPVVALPEGLEPKAGHTPGRPLKLVYTGKFAPRWNTYEMTSLPRRLAARGVDAELHMIGDKIHKDRTDPGFTNRMRVALESTPGLIWHGGHPRAEAMRVTSGCDIGLSWRHPDLDASLELSTKVLEMGSLGVPVVLNRTPMHENLLGADYPLFANTEDEVVDVLAEAAEPATYTWARNRCLEAARDFTLKAAADRLRRYLGQAFPPAPKGAAPRTRVVVAGHDLKFFTRLLDHLRSLPNVEVRVDQWPSLGTHDPEVSSELAAWADVVVCEWCGPNAIWYSEWLKKHGRPEQRLVVRLHRFELYGAWPNLLDINMVDQVVCVSPHYADLTRKMTGWPADKVTVIPNWVDDTQFGRAKLPGAAHHLGFIGMAPWRKRPDLAIDVLEHLRREDPRFTLFVKSKLPWELPWIWNRHQERRNFEGLFHRIRRSPLLSSGVVFDPSGPDVASWLRRVGFVLSTSEDESFHLAPAEGMASGAIPALLPWEGSDRIYDRRWIHDDPAAMAAAIARTVAEGRWEDERAQARDEVTRSYALELVCDQWGELVTRSSGGGAGRTPTAYPAQAPSA